MRALRWSDIDFEGKRINVTQAADRFNNVDAPKSSAAIRTVPMADDLATVLQAWRVQAKDNKGGLVLGTRTGKPISLPNIINRAFTPLQVSLGMTGQEGGAIYAPHKLRHFAASRWIAEGAGVVEVAQWIGHDSPSTTLKVYAHLFKEAALDGRMINSAAAALKINVSFLQVGSHD